MEVSRERGAASHTSSHPSFPSALLVVQCPNKRVWPFGTFHWRPYLRLALKYTFPRARPKPANVGKNGPYPFTVCCPVPTIGPVLRSLQAVTANTQLYRTAEYGTCKQNPYTAVGILASAYYGASMAVAVLSLPSAPLHQQLIPWRSGFTPCALRLPLLSSPRTPATAPSPSAVPGWYHYTLNGAVIPPFFISHLLQESSGR